MRPCRFCCGPNGWGENPPHSEGTCLTEAHREHLAYSRRMLEDAAEAAKKAAKNWPTCPHWERYGESKTFKGRTTNCGRPPCRKAEEEAQR